MEVAFSQRAIAAVMAETAEKIQSDRGYMVCCGVHRPRPEFGF